MRRILVGVVALIGAAAFAPAPLPRPWRGENTETTLQTIQGTWRVTDCTQVLVRGDEWSFVSYNSSTTQVLVSGDEWSFGGKGGGHVSYVVAVHGGRRPAAIDFYNGPVSEKEPIQGRGIIRRKGDELHVVYQWRIGERATSFDRPPHGQYLLKLRREK
jgi:uncharacterized protein (TIGR03067 family)